MQKKRIHPKIKSKLHPRSKHRERYDFSALIKACAALEPFVHLNKYGDKSIDFSNPVAVKMLNKSLLVHHYGITFWDIPPNYLCPPIPGRADYIHYVSDLLKDGGKGEKSSSIAITCLDVGVGANCIYPIIGVAEYGWNFLGTEVDPVALNAANQIIFENDFMQNKVSLRLQENSNNIFTSVVQPEDYFDLVICNPPFHASLKEARAGTERKLRNLKGGKGKKTKLNFGGQAIELWCEGGEVGFIERMIWESKSFSKQCGWFTTLVSKEAHLQGLHNTLEKAKAKKIKTIEMSQGNKISRILAWTWS